MNARQKLHFLDCTAGINSFQSYSHDFFCRFISKIWQKKIFPQKWKFLIFCPFLFVFKSNIRSFCMTLIVLPEFRHPKKIFGQKNFEKRFLANFSSLLEVCRYLSLNVHFKVTNANFFTRQSWNYIFLELSEKFENFWYRVF